MKADFKNSLFFSIYQIILIWFFGAYSFFKSTSSEIFEYAITFLVLLVVHFFSRIVVLKMAKDKKAYRVFNLILYILSSFVSSIVCWIVFGGSSQSIFIFISAFVIPSFFPSLYLFLKGLFKDNEEEVILTNNKLSTQYEPVFKVVPEEPTEVNFILENESGKVLLNVFINQIICFEANDNYVITYYMNKQNELKKSMERISLKKIEELLDGLGVSSFSRVHKSYLIHNEYIEEIKGKAQAQKIKLKNLELLVPVSRSFQVATLKTW